jgi:RNA polymerase sigma-70 factor, ECF subfamily
MQSKDSLLPAPDASLIQRARQGDSGSISWLFECYQPSIFRYLYYRVGEHQAAEDLTSEVFIRMLRALPGYQPQAAPFHSWLFQIARNLAIDYFRQSGRNQALTENLRASDPGPETALDHTLTHDELRLALSKLNNDQREVIVLRFILELPIAQVAQMLGTSGDAVKGLQRRGLLTLRNVMSEK